MKTVQKKYKSYEMADILHQVSELYLSSSIPIDYGTGEKYTAVEVHLLKYIIDHPSKTITDLSKDWDKSKAALSKMIKKLEEKGLIRRENAHDSEKKQLFFATEKGMELHQKHLHYDDIWFGSQSDKLIEKFGEDTVYTTFQVLDEYIKLRRERHYRW